MKKNYSLFVAVVLVCLLVSCGGDVPTNANKGPFSRGGQYYDTLQEAIDSLKGRSVSEDHIIRLNQNASGKGAVITGMVSEIKIDFGSYTYTLAGSSQGIVVEGDNGVEISGGTIELGSGNTFTSVITTKGSTSISGTTIDVSDSDLDAAVTTTSGTLRIMGSTSITAKKDSNALAVSGSGVVKTVSSDVSISGGLSVTGTAELNLDKGNFKLGTLISDSTSKLYKTNEAAIEAFDGNLDEFNNKAVTHESFNVWVPSSAVLSVSVSSSRGLTNMIEANDVFDTGNPSFDLQYAQAVMQCMPFFSKLEQVDGVSSTTNKDELRRLLQYSLYGFSVVPDMDRTKVNDDGVYVYYVAYEGKDVSKPVGVVEYYYNSKESKLTYRQFVMLTILTGNEDHGMENAVLVYCLDDVSVGKDGTLAVNQLKTDGTFETKEAYTDYLWIRNENTSYDVTGNPHFDFERRVMTFRSERGITASFSQPWASFSYEGDSWDKVSDNDTLKVLMKSKSADYQITEDNKDNFDGETAVSFARLVYANGNSIAKENGWASYGDFAAASLRELNTTEHEWLFGTERKTDGTMKNTEFWMSYFDFDNAAEGNKTKRAYSNSQLVYGGNGDDEAHYVMGSSAYVGNGFSNLFGAYSGESSNRSVTEFIITKFLPYCTVASESQIKTFVTNNIVRFKEAEQNDQPYDPDHIHTFSDEWTTDEDFHWHAATCAHKEETKDKSRHNYNPDTWVITKEATIDEPGERYNVCENCGYKRTEITPKIELWDFYEFDGGAIAPSNTYKSLISGDVVIPGEVNGQTVKKIHFSAFSNCENISSITIPDSVTNIEREAFKGCTGLTSITIPDSVTNIEREAFEGCTGLTSITIPDSVTNIEGEAFKGCTSLTSIVIPSSVTSIGRFAFNGCTNLTSLTVSSSVSDLDLSDFYYGCNKLEEFVLYVDSLTSYWNMNLIPAYFPQNFELYVNGKLLSGDVEVPSGIKDIPNNAFSKMTDIESVTIPDTVTSIGDYAFRGCTGLSSISIPDSVTSIGNAAFEGCTSLASITIPNSVKSIGYSAFRECKSLLSICIPDSMTVIENYLFYGCTGLTSITIGNSVTSIGGSSFAGCTGLTSVTIPDSVTVIGGAFEGCTGLKSVTIGNSVTKIDIGAFEGCTGLTSVTIPDSVTSIEWNAFKDCSDLTDITLGNSLTSIGQGAFSGCAGLTSIIIPDSVTSIGGSAFAGCTGLTSVTIGKSVKSVGFGAFSQCSGVKKVVLYSAVTDFTYSPLEELIVYADSLSSYLNMNLVIPVDLLDFKLYVNGELLSGAIEIPYGIKVIPKDAFYYCSDITGITLADTVIRIDDYAFNGCSGLTSITIPDSVTSIGRYAFNGCTNLKSLTVSSSISDLDLSGFYKQLEEFIVYADSLTSYWNMSLAPSYLPPSFKLYVDGELLSGAVEIPSGLEGIPKNAFNKVSGITSVTIPDTVTSIGDYAFLGCTDLSSISIPDSVTIIGDSAFEGCAGLSSITIPKSVESIGNSAFEGCTGLSGIIIPDSVTNLGPSTFRGCTGLTSITIPDSVASIGSGVFEGCTGLTSITIPDSVTSIGFGVFVGCSGLKSIAIPSSVTRIGDYAFSHCTGLSVINYSGTTEQWNSITRGIAGYNVPPNIEVHCSNGDVYF